MARVRADSGRGIKISNCGVTEKCEVEWSADEKSGPVLHLLEPGLDQRGQFADVAFGQVGQGPFEVRSHRHKLHWAAPDRSAKCGHRFVVQNRRDGESDQRYGEGLGIAG